MKKLLQLLLALTLSVLLIPAIASTTPSLKCDSCAIYIKSLDQPVKLSGNWLFTRDDNSTNKDVGIAVAHTIFKSGFSTASAVTEVSGRGVGMDVVKGFLQSEGGDVKIEFTDDKHGHDFRQFQLVMNLPSKFAVKR